MAFDPAFFVTNDRFAMPRECNWLDVKRGFLAHLANNRVGKLLADLNGPARQGVKAERWLARSPHDQHLAVADDGSAHRQKRALRIGSLVSHALYRFIS